MSYPSKSLFSDRIYFFYSKPTTSLSCLIIKDNEDFFRPESYKYLGFSFYTLIKSFSKFTCFDLIFSNNLQYNFYLYPNCNQNFNILFLKLLNCVENLWGFIFCYVNVKVNLNILIYPPRVALCYHRKDDYMTLLTIVTTLILIFSGTYIILQLPVLKDSKYIMVDFKFIKFLIIK